MCICVCVLGSFGISVFVIERLNIQSFVCFYCLFGTVVNL